MSIACASPFQHLNPAQKGHKLSKFVNAEHLKPLNLYMQQNTLDDTLEENFHRKQLEEFSSLQSSTNFREKMFAF